MINVRAGKLTDRERAVIDAIRWLAVQGGWVRAHEIAARTGQSWQGAAETAASAIRKDLVASKHGRGHVWYALTDRGWRLAAPRARQARP